MALDPNAHSALQGAAPLVCLLIKIELPEATLTLCDGSAQVLWDGYLWSGSDDVYGAVDQIEAIDDAEGTEAPAMRMVFLPASLVALAALSAPANQGSPVKLWLAVLNPATGHVIGSPELLFLGELDTAEVDASESVTTLTFDVVSAWERLFDNNEGLRLNNAFMKSAFPGALGLEYVTQTSRRLPWNIKAARPAVVRDTVGGSPGGGYGGAPYLGGGWRESGRWEQH